MVISVLQYILDIIDSVVLLDYIFIPIIVMSLFSIVCRLVLRRYS